MSPVPVLDWTSVRALLELARLDLDADTVEGLLCLEAGALEEFSRAAEDR